MFVTHLLLVLQVYNTKPTHTKSWARNLLMLDLTFGPSFKVKWWFTGFGELSFRWIQIRIGSPMRRSSFYGHMTSSLSDIFQQSGASPWLNSSERWSGSAKILHVSQLFLSIQRNLCPFEFHPIQSLTKAGDSTFYCVKHPYLILINAYVLAGAHMDDQTRIFLK